MTIDLTFEIVLRSDYHISSGYGLPASADSALLRDKNGVPVISGTILTGLLRDGMWRLLQLPPLQQYRTCEASGGLDPNIPAYCTPTADDTTMCPLCRIFGSPSHPKQWYMSTAYHVPSPSRKQRNVAKKSSLVTSVGGQIIQRVRVNPVTRRAEPNKLFSQEDGDRRLTFRFSVRCEHDDAHTQDEAAFLVAAARFVRELGRSRRRGQGECLLQLVEPESEEGLKTLARLPDTSLQDTLLRRFQKRWIDTDEATRPVAPRQLVSVMSVATQPDAPTDTSTSHPVRVRVVLRTDEPVLVSRKVGGNQFESQDSISGQTFWGALAHRATQRLGLQGRTWQDNAAYQNFVNTFYGTHVRFPVLHPAYKKSDNTLCPAFPTPLNILTCKTFPYFNTKRQGHPFYSVLNSSDEHRCTECGEALTSVGGYVYYDDGDEKWKSIDVDKRSDIHIRLDPKRGRVAARDMFSYVAIESGQYFVGDLICQNEQSWHTLKALVGIPDNGVLSLRIGKASRRGYGNVTIQCNPLDTDAPDIWAGLSFEQRVVQQSADDNAVFTMTLMTDAILPDQWGRFWMGFETTLDDTTHRVASWLHTATGLQLNVQAAFGKTSMVDGFQSHLGVPRFRDSALVAGSTVVFTIVDPPEDWANRLQKMEQTGIGVRRNEGFGHIVINHPLHSKQPIASNVSLLPDKQDMSHNVSLLPDKQDMSHNVFLEQKFVKWVRKKREKQNATVWKDHRFLALARWLLANADKPLDWIKEQLPTETETDNNVGNPSHSLIQAIGEQEYGERKKDNFFFFTGEGKEGCTKIRKILDEMTSHDGFQLFASVGIKMLAEWVARAASTEEEATQ